LLRTFGKTPFSLRQAQGERRVDMLTTNGL
jgi:hypothetical protein